MIDEIMMDVFPNFIKNLPKASIPIKGCNAYLLQGDKQQFVFMEFKKDVELPEHTHKSQWEIVLEGEVDVWINKEKKSYFKGDRFYIPSNIPHRAFIYAGYSSIAIFLMKVCY